MKGNWWKVSVYNLFFFLAVALPFAVIIFILMNVIKGPIWLAVTPVLTLVITGLIISFNSVFQQFLAQELYSKKPYRISVLMKVMTAAIIILPILGAAGVIFLLPIILHGATGG
jgi:Na+/melibiose symporter-like transporter